MDKEEEYRIRYWVLIIQIGALLYLLPHYTDVKQAFVIMGIVIAIILWCGNLVLWVVSPIETSSTHILPNLHRSNPGFIYVMKRQDGIYKIGRCNDITRRLKQHTQDYGQEFELIQRFVVSDYIEMEKLALNMTLKFSYSEKSRNELRKMSQSELNTFLKKFESICKESVCK